MIIMSLFSLIESYGSFSFNFLYFMLSHKRNRITNYIAMNIKGAIMSFCGFLLFM